MIVSVSRRTDVPAFYMDWFLNRLREGFVLVRNPYNPSQVSRVSLARENIECMVFWTKNPQPMIQKLPELAPYPYYIQYTVNPYGKEMESRLPDLETRLDVFRRLADTLGKHGVVWRYSPVVLNERYTPQFHCDSFGRLAALLSGYTNQCKLSFIELYAKIRNRMAGLGVADSEQEETYALARQFAALAGQNGIELSACGKPDLRPAGIPLASCVDGKLIQKITGRTMRFRKDPGQRGACNCVESVDIGSYHTCLNGCAYCYANHSHASAARKAAGHDPDSPFLCDALRPGDTIIDRKTATHTVPVQARLPL